jgi:Bacterial Ig-like domain (group 3)
VRINKSVVIGAITAMMTAVAVPLLALPASAATPPPWEPDPNALGTLTFYNSAGQVVTSGTDLTHLFDYLEASTTDPTAGTRAEYQFAQPIPSTPTGNFPVSTLSLATSFPNASAPAPLNTSPNPVDTLSATDGNLANFIASVTPQTAAGYANMFQIRLLTTGPGGVGTANNGGQYWDADVLVSGTSWQEVYPSQGTTTATTTTALAASPATTAQQGASVTLTATVTASDSTHPAGTVQFMQDGFNVGSPVAVSTTDGTASLGTTALLPSAPGGTALTAAFTPTDNSSYTGSTSSPLDYTVDPIANVPTIAGPHQAGQRETCTDGMLDFGVVASYTWLANGAKIGTGASFTVPGTAYKKALACQATVHDGAGPVSTPMTSTSVTVILGKALKPSKKPTLSGAHKVGKLETVHAGTWPRGAKFTYQWLLNGKVIKHATRSTLRLIRSERGKRISCRVTAHLTGFANGSSTTSSVKVS